MWIAEPPVDANTNPPAIYLAAKTNNLTGTHKRVVGACLPVEIDNQGESIGLMSATGDAETYMFRYENRSMDFTGADVTIVQAPKHGRLVLDKRVDVPDKYIVDKGYDGGDAFTLRVKKGDVSVTVKYFVLIDYAADLKYYTCSETPKGEPGGLWKISLPTPEGSSPLASILSTARDRLTFADLTGSEVGQTLGTGPTAQITLDTGAAGHGWYIDYTPYLNDEYLPTSNPLEWIAKPGSEAEGKMDLLTVLLHEYGHALGLEHSADAHDLMASTLQPGVRRLPSAAELDRMA